MYTRLAERFGAFRVHFERGAAEPHHITEERTRVAFGGASARNDFAVRAAVLRACDTARACRITFAIGHGSRARHPDPGSRATSRSRAHQ